MDINMLESGTANNQQQLLRSRIISDNVEEYCAKYVKIYSDLRQVKFQYTVAYSAHTNQFWGEELNRKADIRHLKRLGSKGNVLKLKQKLHKLDKNGELLTFMGYDEKHWFVNLKLKYMI